MELVEAVEVAEPPVGVREAVALGLPESRGEAEACALGVALPERGGEGVAEVLAQAVTETLAVEESEAEGERVPPGAPPGPGCWWARRWPWAAGRRWAGRRAWRAAWQRLWA